MYSLQAIEVCLRHAIAVLYNSQVVNARSSTTVYWPNLCQLDGEYDASLDMVVVGLY